MTLPPRFSGFHQLSIQQRRTVLGEDTLHSSLLDTGGWDPEIGNTWIENVIGPLALPLALAPHFIINGKPTWIPMTTEEPSVVAAAAHAAKLASIQGGFEVDTPLPLTTAQIQWVVLEPQQAWEHLQSRLEELRTLLTGLDPQLEAAGGGLHTIECKDVFEDELIVLLHIHTADAMGANIANTFAETAGRWIEQNMGGTVIGRILTNAYPQRITHAKASFFVESLSVGGFSGPETAQRMLRLARWAQRDPLRTVTHVKGILNGIMAVAQATCNDTRAVAMATAAAMQFSPYAPSLSHWELSVDGSVLTGQIALPIPLGTIGGLTRAHPLVRLLLERLELTSANRLCQAAAACGLANHFAALRALATEGIQAGHMRLHRRKEKTSEP